MVGKREEPLDAKMPEQSEEQQNGGLPGQWDSRMEVHRKPSLWLLFVITSVKLAKKAERMFEEGRVPFVYRSNGQGTASSEMMDILGLSGIDKSVLITVLPKVFADEMLKKLRKQLRLGFVDTGIAFTVPVSGINGRMLKLVEKVEAGKTVDTTASTGTESAEHRNSDIIAKRSEQTMDENTYSLIMAIVDRGYSEAVMEAARPEGASGGTVINSRRVGTEEAMRFWGISVQQERELVLILARKEEKKTIMKAVAETCGMRSEAHGVVLSMPVDGVTGLE